MKQIKFTKMHGAGNDFIMIDGFEYNIINPNKIARKLCNRHFSIGGDGLILILPPEDKKNDYKMRIFNADGSEAEMCGNGIRCFAHFLKERNLCNKDILKIETLAGIIKPEIISKEKEKSMVKVDMGKPIFTPEKIPVKITGLAYIKDYKLKIEDEIFSINCLSTGNPHTVIFVDDIDKYPLKRWGPLIENNLLFPEKTNVEFIKILSPSEIKMQVWERGAGVTLACGTGATASVIAGIKNELLANSVLVHLPGGDLTIDWSGEIALMTGPAETVFSGTINL